MKYKVAENVYTHKNRYTEIYRKNYKKIKSVFFDFA